jgi:pimeloyl-ACP methyl ester carboxylesterase
VLVLVPLLWLILFCLLGVVALVLLNLALVRVFERLIPPVGRFVEVEGVRLHVVDSGENADRTEPPLLLLHGMLAQLNHFTYALAALFPERRVVMVDRPGAGYSQATAAQGLKGQADAIAKAIDRLGLGKPVVVGHSFGGSIALTLALEHPDRVAGLALIAPLTTPVFAAPKAFEQLASLGPWFVLAGAWTFGPLGSLSRVGLAKRLIFAPEPVAEGFWTRAGGLLSMRPAPIVAAARELKAIPRELPGLMARYPTLSVPVAVLFGDEDVVLDPEAQGPAFCARVPGAELSVVEGGHMLPLTQPKVTEAFIRKLLARVSAPSIPQGVEHVLD